MKRLHAIRESLIECGLLPAVVDELKDLNAMRNYVVAEQLDFALRGRGFGVPSMPGPPIAGMHGEPVPPLDNQRRAEDCDTAAAALMGMVSDLPAPCANQLATRAIGFEQEAARLRSLS